MLVVENLTKRFGGFSAVTECSFTVEPGTITSLIGPNGAGKTTAFNLITGYLAKTSGKVTFDGDDISSLSPERIMGLGLVRTFQIPRQFLGMSVIENLMIIPPSPGFENFWSAWIPSSALRHNEEQLQDRAEQVLEMLKLTHLRDQAAGSLSGGQRKLLELARVLLAAPKLVLLDEPGAGINPSLMAQLMDHVTLLRKEHGISFLLVEHNMELVTKISDHVIVMASGSVLFEGTPQQVVSNPAVLEAYLGNSEANKIERAHGGVQ